MMDHLIEILKVIGIVCAAVAILFLPAVKRWLCEKPKPDDEEGDDQMTIEVTRRFWDGH